MNILLLIYLYKHRKLGMLEIQVITNIYTFSINVRILKNNLSDNSIMRIQSVSM